MPTRANEKASAVPKRLTATIASALSLDRYEVGVPCESLRLLLSITVLSDAGCMEIDVLAGISAGATTSAIAAQKLFGGAAFVTSLSL